MHAVEAHSVHRSSDTVESQAGSSSQGPLLSSHLEAFLRLPLVPSIFSFVELVVLDTARVLASQIKSGLAGRCAQSIADRTLHVCTTTLRWSPHNPSHRRLTPHNRFQRVIDDAPFFGSRERSRWSSEGIPHSSAPAGIPATSDRRTPSNPRGVPESQNKRWRLSARHSQTSMFRF